MLNWRYKKIMNELKNHIRIVYSILHFQTLEMTILCIEKLIQLNSGHNYFILVIDNGSTNKSGIILKQKYTNNKRVIIILNKRNLGFAKGNNIGYKYAKNKLHADIIVVMNNDILIYQSNFCCSLLELVNSNPSVSVFAPDIINKKGEHQNPVRTKELSIKDILFVLLYNIWLQIVMRIPTINKVFITYLNKRHSKVTKNCILNRASDNQKNIVPHGAMIIYANDYLKNEPIAFNPQTFLFCEEDLLYIYLKKKGYISMFSNTIKVFHLEDVSTDNYTTNEIRKRLFISQHKIHSCIILLKERYINKY